MSSTAIKNQIDTVNREILNIEKSRQNEMSKIERFQREINNYQRNVNNYDKQILEKKKKLAQLQKDYDREIAKEK